MRLPLHRRAAGSLRKRNQTRNAAKGIEHMRNTTTTAIGPANTTPTAPEFGRIRDVQHLFGLKRGTVYNLLRDGKIKGCLLRVRGQKSGVRLISLDSVREFICGQMEKQNSQQN
jgi:hypothetical protein